MIETLKLYGESEYTGKLSAEEEKKLKEEVLLELGAAIIKNADRYIRFKTFNAFDRLNCRKIVAEIRIERVEEEQ